MRKVDGLFIPIFKKGGQTEWKNRKPLNSFEPKGSEQRHSFYRNSTSWSVWRIEKNIWNRVYKPQFRQKRKRSRSPAGPRRLRNSDAHKRIAAPKAFCVLQERLRPSPKSGKVCRSDTRPGDVRERAARVEGNDSAPVRNAPCFAVCAVVCDPVGEGECVPAFDCESKRGPFVGEVEKRDERWSEIEFETAALTDFSLLLVLRVHSEPGNVCI